MTDPNNPFDRPQTLDRGSDTAEEVWLAVGRALTRWEQAETEIAWVFNALMQPLPAPVATHEPGARAYAAVITFNGRQDMLQAASDAYFNEHFGTEPKNHYAQRVLNHLIKISRKLGARRNEIAHALVSPASFTGPGFYLHPGIHSSKVNVAYIGDYQYTGAQVDVLAERFSELGRCFTWYRCDLLRPLPDIPRQPRPDWIPPPEARKTPPP
jgi:hypothetical protein